MRCNNKQCVWEGEADLLESSLKDLAVARRVEVKTKSLEGAKAVLHVPGVSRE